MSRAQNSFKNIITSNLSQVLLLLLNFLTRTVFVRVLGEEYLGINGLYSNVLTVLSLADLGIGSAIVFKLYKPIEEKNEDRIIALMKLYRRLYTIIGFVILFLGVCVIPFLPVIISDYDKLGDLGLNPILLLMLYVFRSASSYWFFAYKRSMVYAHQKTYLLTIRGYYVQIISCVCEILVLKFWHDFLVSTFIAYTVVMLAFTIIQNIVFSRVANKYFPYLKKTTTLQITKDEIRDIFKSCGALFVYKANNAVIRATDNIALSAMLNLTVVGLYSNYSLLYSNIRIFLIKIMDSLGPAIGSIHATGNLRWKRNIFDVMNLATMLLFGVVAVPLAVCGDEFIRLWLGEHFVMNTVTVGGQTYPLSVGVLVGIELFVYGYTEFLGKFRYAFGLFRQLFFRPIISMIINLVLTVTLIPVLGAAGPVISTIVAFCCTTLIFDPMVIIRRELFTPLRKYYLKNLVYFAVTFLAGGICYFVCGRLPGSGVLYFILHGFLCVMITGIVYLIFFGRTRSMRLLLTFLPNARLRSLAYKILMIRAEDLAADAAEAAADDAAKDAGPAADASV